MLMARNSYWMSGLVASANRGVRQMAIVSLRSYRSNQLDSLRFAYKGSAHERSTFTCIISATVARLTSMKTGKSFAADWMGFPESTG